MTCRDSTLPWICYNQKKWISWRLKQADWVMYGFARVTVWGLHRHLSCGISKWVPDLLEIWNNLIATNFKYEKSSLELKIRRHCHWKGKHTHKNSIPILRPWAGSLYNVTKGSSRRHLRHTSQWSSATHVIISRGVFPHFTPVMLDLFFLTAQQFIYLIFLIFIWACFDVTLPPC